MTADTKNRALDVEGAASSGPECGRQKPDQAIPLTRLTRRDILRAIVFRCSTPLRTPRAISGWAARRAASAAVRSEEHTSELQSLMRISYAVFFLKKKTPLYPLLFFLFFLFLFFF